MIEQDLELKNGILQGLIENYRDQAVLAHEEKIILCDALADFVQVLRRKYELTTTYYMPSEYRAISRYSDDPAVRFKADTQARWVYDSKGELRCSACGKRALRKITAIQEHSKFCPQCGKRMIFQG